MNDEDVKQFITAFEDFMKHADVEVQNYVRREATRAYTTVSYTHLTLPTNREV